MHDQAEIIEIGARKGLQYHPKYIEVEKKVSFINMLFDAGFQKMEATSFVHPRVMPQMRDSFEVLQKINKNPKGITQALIPNETGCRNAIACGAQELVVWVYTTDELNYISQHRTRSETLKEINSIVQIAKENRIRVSAWIASAFGYPGMHHQITWQEVKELAAKLIQLGCEEVCLADEFCLANPKLIKELIKVCSEEIEKSRLLFHFHDNKGLGLANIIAAYEEGIRKFKSCIGGIGRNIDLRAVKSTESSYSTYPNIATEDLIYVFQEMGISTGIDLNKLIKCGLFAEELLEMKLNSLVIHNNLI